MTSAYQSMECVLTTVAATGTRVELLLKGGATFRGFVRDLPHGSGVITLVWERDRLDDYGRRSYVNPTENALAVVRVDQIAAITMLLRDAVDGKGNLDLGLDPAQPAQALR